MAGVIRLFSFQSRIKFWCSLIVQRSETRHMLIAQTVSNNVDILQETLGWTLQDGRHLKIYNLGLRLIISRLL